MELISVNVGQPREVEWDGKVIETGIYKEPVAGRAKVTSLNIDGDRQADLSVHGGVDMAVYAYSANDYDFWKRELSLSDLPWGSFGENLSISGISDREVFIGDIFRIGSAELQVTQPRMPCFKLGIKFGAQGFIKRFLSARRTGFYLRVLQEGHVQAGDPVGLISRDEHELCVVDLVELYVGEGTSESMARALQVEALPPSWKDHIRARLER